MLLHAGPLSALYENGDLRYIRLGNREIVRRIYGAVRDRNWGTIPMEITPVETVVEPDRFRIVYHARHRQEEIDFAWTATLRGEPDGTVTFDFDGEALSSFARNRIGLCVLHPIHECAGTPCRVRHGDGSEERSAFPRRIAPHQPFLDIAALSHAVAPGVEAEIAFSGEAFEMEDQRNWTDASFKTYGTPLSLPFPVEVAAGTRVRQSVRLTLRGEATEPERTERGPVTVTVGGDPKPLPALGFGVASHGQPLTPDEIARLRALRPAHLRVDLPLGQPGWEARLRQASAEARPLGAGLEAAILLDDDAEAHLVRLRDVAVQAEAPVVRWLVFPVQEKTTTERWLTLARESLADATPGAGFIAGTNAYFAELNRGRPPVPVADGVCYSANPQVHAFDDRSVVETIEALPATVETARSFSADLPIGVTPVTLRRRFNADATGTVREPGPGELPDSVDPRQPTAFAAAWTVGALSALARAGVDWVTLFETTGWRGLMETQAGSPAPFPSKAGMVYPVYHVLAAIAPFAGDSLHVEVSDGLRIAALALRRERTRLVVANVTPEPQAVVIHGLPRRVTVRRLTEGFMADYSAAGAPTELTADAGTVGIEIASHAVLLLEEIVASP